MQRRELLLSYAPLADFIARMNGDGCEALIHDVRDPLHSVIYITQPTPVSYTHLTLPTT